MKKIEKLFKSLSLSAAITGVALFSSCGPRASKNNPLAGNNQAIMGGNVANESFQKQNGIVGLLLEVERQDLGGAPVTSQGICTGVLIAKRWVLTAGHCVRDKGLKKIIVIFDSNFRNAVRAHNFVFGALAIANKSYNPTEQFGAFSDLHPWNDIALVSLTEDAPSAFNVAPLPTTKDVELLNADAKLTLAGFGVTDFNMTEHGNDKSMHDSAGILRSVSHIVINDVTIDNKEIVIDQENGARGACHGDSGGPAYLEEADGKLVLIGITSRGTNLNGNCDRENVLTNVFGHLDWINKQIHRKVKRPAH